MATPLTSGASKAGTMELGDMEGSALVFRKLFFEVVDGKLKFYNSGAATQAKLFGKTALVSASVGMKTFANAAENGLFLMPNADPDATLWLNAKSVMSRREWIAAMVAGGATKTKFKEIEPLVRNHRTYKELQAWAIGLRDGVRAAALVPGAAPPPSSSSGGGGYGAPPSSSDFGGSGGGRSTSGATSVPTTAILTSWLNSVLARSSMSIQYRDLERDIKTGLPVLHVIKALTNEKLPPHHVMADTVSTQVENWTLIQSMISLLGIPTSSWTPVDIVNGSTMAMRRILAALRSYFDGGKYKPGMLTQAITSGKLSSLDSAAGSMSSSGAGSSSGGGKGMVTRQSAASLSEWANRILAAHKVRLVHLDDDCRDGLVFIKLIEEMSGVPLDETTYHKEHIDGAAKLENIQAAFGRMEDDGIKVSDLREADVMRGDLGTIQDVMSRIQVGYSGARNTVTRDELYKSALTTWVNSKLATRDRMWQVKDIFSDLADSIVLMLLAEILTGRLRDSAFNEKPHRKPLRIANMKLVEKMLLAADVPHEGWSVEGIVTKDPTQTTALLASLRDRFG